MKIDATTWDTFYQTATAKQLGYPSEPLVRMMKGDYIPGIDKNYEGKRALDVGFGHGNNAAFLANLGLEICGVEIHQGICDQTTERLKELGVSSDLRLGNNREIPFEDDAFDVIVSWATLHYETTLEDYLLALKEFSRVLKPGGRVFIETVHTKHCILEGCVAKGPHLREIRRKGDIREGQTFFCLDDPVYAKEYYSRYFKDVLVGYVETDLFTDTLASYLITCTK